MEKLGERLSSDLLTFKYPGRESLTVNQLLEAKPSLRGLYVYDVCLTTGSLLYLSAGGIGVTREPYIVDMHKFIKSSSAIGSLKNVFLREFDNRFTKGRFDNLKKTMNGGLIGSISLESQAKLYLLWCGSGFKHRYRGLGYDSQYQPTLPNYEALALASRQSREKNLLFRREDFCSFSESIINENRLSSYVRVVNEFHELGHKVCVSALFQKRGLVFRDYVALFPHFEYLITPGFKVSKLTSEPGFSEIHFFNF
jgi:hypothetical protein